MDTKRNVGSGLDDADKAQQPGLVERVVEKLGEMLNPLPHDGETRNKPEPPIAPF